MVADSPRILILGHSRAGKSTAARILAEHYGCKWADTSTRIIGEYAEQFNIDDDAIERNKDNLNRETLYQYAREVCLAADNPAVWVDACDADIVSGVRNPQEFAAARAHFDAAIWIDREGYGPGETDRVPREVADLHVLNNGGGEAEFADRLIDHVVPWLERREISIFGRYRHWQRNGLYDLREMFKEELEERYWAGVLRESGLPIRVFAPVCTFKPLDQIWQGDRILALSLAHIEQRSKPSDAFLAREGWEADEFHNIPAGKGAAMEIDLATDRGLKALTNKHGEAALLDAVKELCA